jgi:hypothetical protein
MQNTGRKPRYHLISVKNEVTYLVIKAYALRAELTSIGTPSQTCSPSQVLSKKQGPMMVTAVRAP